MVRGGQSAILGDGLGFYLVGVRGVHLGYQVRPPLSVRVETSDTKRILGAFGCVKALRVSFSYFLQALTPLRIGMLLSSARLLEARRPPPTLNAAAFPRQASPTTISG